MAELEVEDGVSVCEITDICEYFEDTNPSPALIGTNAKEKGECRMWTRRVDLNVCEPLANGFRFSQGLPLFKDRIVTVPEAADGLKRIARDRLAWGAPKLAHRDYLCAKRFTLAAILPFC